MEYHKHLTRLEKKFFGLWVWYWCCFFGAILTNSGSARNFQGIRTGLETIWVGLGKAMVERSGFGR